MLAARVGRAFAGGRRAGAGDGRRRGAPDPVGVVDGGGELLARRVLAVGLAVAMLSSAIPYSLELEALRRLPEGTFGVLMSLEPAVAALVGPGRARPGLSAAEIVAIALVVAASAGALAARAPAPVEA